jgi:hypothetical protein
MRHARRDGRFKRGVVRLVPTRRNLSPSFAILGQAVRAVRAGGQEQKMAVNKPVGDNARRGAVRKLAVKKTAARKRAAKKFKGVRAEKKAGRR